LIRPRCTEKYTQGHQNRSICSSKYFRTVLKQSLLSGSSELAVCVSCESTPLESSADPRGDRFSTIGSWMICHGSCRHRQIPQRSLFSREASLSRVAYPTYNPNSRKWVPHSSKPRNREPSRSSLWHLFERVSVTLALRQPSESAGDVEFGKKSPRRLTRFQSGRSRPCEMRPCEMRPCEMRPCEMRPCEMRPNGAPQNQKRSSCEIARQCAKAFASVVRSS
jgi:hypothetical protein